MDIERAGYDRCEATYDTVCDRACDTEEEGVIVGYSKQKTVFDDRENDWKQFARQQAEFYANAEQYIYNLQEDLNELDEEIEQILQEIEGRIIM